MDMAPNLNQHHPPKKDQRVPLFKWIGVILALAIALGVGGLLLGQSLLAPQSSVPKAVEQQSPQLARLQSSDLFDFLRFVDFFGNHFVMLRHNPTAQRIILLTGQGDKGDAYVGLYNQQLSVTEFSLLIQLFKFNSKFEHSTIQVTQVVMDKTGMAEDIAKPYRMPYKHYVISATVDGKPEAFEAYIAKINRNNQIMGLIFTFNSQGYASLAPFKDVAKAMNSPE